MKMQLHSLRLVCRTSEEVVVFARDVTFIHGTLSVGKSSIARLVDFCLGGDLERTTAIQRELVSAHLSLTVGMNRVLLERNKGEGQVQASWEKPEGELETVLVRAKGDGPVTYGTDIQNLSDLLFHLLGFPIIRVRRRTGDEDSPMVRLSFRDILRFCYLKQEDLDSSFFRLNTPILAEKSKDSLNFFTGYYSERLSLLEAELQSFRAEQRAKRDAAKKISEFLAGFGFSSEAEIEAQLDAARARSEEIAGWLAEDRQTYASETHFVDEQRLRLRHLSDQLLKEQEVAEDLESRIAEQKELRSELIAMKFKTDRADRAREVLAGSAFENCPNCGRPLSEHKLRPEGACYLCLQGDGHASRSLDVTRVRSDLEARILDIDGSVRRHEAALVTQRRRVDSLRSEKFTLDRELEELLSTYETDRIARVRDKERVMAEANERMRFFKRVREMPGAVSKMLEEADAMSTDIGRVERDIVEEQRKLSYADKNFADLERNFLEALLAVRVPGVLRADKVAINRKTLIPEIWPGGDEGQAYSFYNAGSGGKKTLITICFALALHRTAAANGMPVPSILLIDTPLKNITPDINPALVSAFYDYLYGVAEGDLRGHQVVIIDQLLVKPPSETSLEFSERLMTTGDPDHPPLISYYDGP
ncbi:MAG: hypothetical protein ABT940_12215 [Alphaproteobacteria bacterium]